MRSQINPHFLFNTLNFLYAESLLVSERLSDGILKLADMMRYSISGTESSKGTVPLQEEVAQLQNAISLAEMRFNEKLFLETELAAVENADLHLPPMLLLTLFENMLKHGDLSEPEHPASIRLYQEGTYWLFITRNKKRTAGSGIPSTGIGLQNVRQRLERVYGGQARLEILDSGNEYKVCLYLPALQA